MGKALTEKEREIIYQKLIENCKAIILEEGYKNVSISKLTKLTGISQGQFYNFFSSKELIFFHILELEQEKYINHILNNELPDDNFSRNLSDILVNVFVDITNNKLITQAFEYDNFKNVLMNIPKEQLNSHITNDNDNIFKIISKYESHLKLLIPKNEFYQLLFNYFIFNFLFLSNVSNSKEMIQIFIESIIKYSFEEVKT
ncbi:TetR/AcrR family transcriptional regulator [Macrococcus animalis]|uniref:TetR/AcrR family transcriptional regulator n=1 Tax=Macrococcus animalis TaxID=3395467 RepID=UPI0039BDA4C6